MSTNVQQEAANKQPVKLARVLKVRLGTCSPVDCGSAPPCWTIWVIGMQWELGRFEVGKGTCTPGRCPPFGGDINSRASRAWISRRDALAGGAVPSMYRCASHAGE